MKYTVDATSYNISCCVTKIKVEDTFYSLHETTDGLLRLTFKSTFYLWEIYKFAFCFFNEGQNDIDTSYVLAQFNGKKQLTRIIFYLRLLG